MDPTTQLLVYKVTTILCGTFLCGMGFILFKTGIFESSGDIDATIRDMRLVLRRAAPGTIFLIMGGAIVIVSLIKGYTVESKAPPHNDFNSAPVVSVSGAASLSYQQNVRLAQAITTVYSEFESKPALTARLRVALDALVDFRGKVAEANLPSEDIDFYFNSRDAHKANPSSFSETDLKRINAVGAFFEAKIDED